MKYGCIGEKLGHSFSKEIHAKLFDYQYDLVEISPDRLDDFMVRRDFIAINVTIPYKEAVIAYLDEISDTARLIGAVNTVVNKNGRLIGYNTDFLGMKALINRSGIDIKDKKVLVLGSGGTSKTANAVANSLGSSEVYRVSRSGRGGCITYEDAVSKHNDSQIIINTTPCGMFPHTGESAVNVEDFPKLQGVVDVVYNPLHTKLVCDALEKGILAVGGLYMLVAQAVFAAEKFVDEKIPLDRIEEIYQEILEKKKNK